MRIDSILVLGGGSAGLLAALTIRRKLPHIKIRVVRSPEIGVIGVGESTTANVPVHLFSYLGLSQRRFYEMARPSWKMGIHFLWGPRPCFEYSFMQQMDVRYTDLPRPNGYYCDEDFSNVEVQSALMLQGKSFLRNSAGGPEFPQAYGFHLENVKFVKALETFATESGIEFIDAKVQGVEKGGEGVAAVILEDGRRLTADFFIDASGFRSELLGRAMEEPFVSFSSSLFNDRALVGSWARTDEPILPYTTAETMDAGWCWRIDHPESINRGYVYSSSAISDDEARAEYLRKNPRAVPNERIVKFRSGRYGRSWVGNVMAIGNASGFVEPLESSALMVACWQAKTFVEFLQFVGPTPTIRDLFNDAWAKTWDEIRDFLALHFRLNTRLDTPYWRRCRAEADISRLQNLLHFYDENGPTGFLRYHMGNTGSLFGVEGFLVVLVGCRFPYRGRHLPAPGEMEIFRRCCERNRLQAETRGMDCREALACVHHPGWRWTMDEQPARPFTIAGPVLQFR